MTISANAIRASVPDTDTDLSLFRNYKTASSKQGRDQWFQRIMATYSQFIHLSVHQLNMVTGHQIDPDTIRSDIMLHLFEWLEWMNINQVRRPERFRFGGYFKIAIRQLRVHYARNYVRGKSLYQNEESFNISFTDNADVGGGYLDTSYQPDKVVEFKEFMNLHNESDKFNDEERSWINQLILGKKLKSSNFSCLKLFKQFQRTRYAWETLLLNYLATN